MPLKLFVNAYMKLSIVIINLNSINFFMKYIELIKANSLLVLGVVSTASLVSISISLRSLLPVADWAKIQNDCIQRTTAFEGLPDKVWSCNGGGKY